MSRYTVLVQRVGSQRWFAAVGRRLAGLDRRVYQLTKGRWSVIGRHGRADPVKWPRDPEQILDAYPETDDLRVRVLGGGEIAVKRLGRQPANWDVVRFGAEEPDEFLRTIDFFVYFHDPDWLEAFGRTILEAMASGVPVILGEHFRSSFDDAALYCTPAGAPALVRELYADPERYRAVVSRAREFAERRYGHQSHLTRLAQLGHQRQAIGPDRQDRQLDSRGSCPLLRTQQPSQIRIDL